MTLPSDWDDTIQGAFFTDDENPSLVEESEMTTNWEALSDEQKEVVRSHCETVDTAASTTTGTAAGTAGASGTTGTATDNAASGTTSGSSSTSTDSTAAGGATTDTDSTASTAAGTDTATGSADAGASMEVAEADMQELCSRVMTMN